MVAYERRCSWDQFSYMRASQGDTRCSLTTERLPFIDGKAPKSGNQLAAVVAYYHKFQAPQGERKESINKEDLVDACRKAVVKRPQYPAQVLVNACGAGLLDRAAEGHYSINSVGENLVAMTLPERGTPARQGVKKKSPKARTKRKK